MGQLFPSWSNSLALASIIGGVGGAIGLIVALSAINRSNYWTRTYVPIEQPVEFSHQHHIGGLGIDCRYCHTSVEESAFANIPPTKTCMTCHSQIWKDSPALLPVRESWSSNRPLRWTRVHDLPDFVFFNHSIHVQKGVGCSTCHGQVDQMPLTWKEHPLWMQWCLECHDHPERFIRPKEEVFNMHWTPPPDQTQRGRELVQSYGIVKNELTNCYICHR